MNNKITFVNINDIEDIIIAKIQIDKDDPDITDRSNLNEFIKKYCLLDCILTNNEKTIPFKISEIFYKKYIFYSSDIKEDLQLLANMLKKINYDYEKLKLKDSDLSSFEDNSSYYIIRNNLFYII